MSNTVEMLNMFSLIHLKYANASFELCKQQRLEFFFAVFLPELKYFLASPFKVRSKSGLQSFEREGTK